MPTILNADGISYNDATQSYSLNRVERAIFDFGFTTVAVSVTNQVNINGLASTDTTGVGTARSQLSAASYG